MDLPNAAKLMDAGITSDKLGDAAITKLGDAAITTAKLMDAAITPAKLRNAAITPAKLRNAAITSAKLGDAAITKLGDTALSTILEDTTMIPVKIMDNAISNRLAGDHNRFEGYGQFDPKVFEHEGLNARDQYNKWVQETKDKLVHLDEFEGKEYKVPSISHSVYFTDNAFPKQMKDLYVQKYIDTSNRLNTEDSNFNHYFWTNNPDSIPEEIKEMPNFEVRSIDEFEDHFLFHNLVDLIKKGQSDSRLFVEASDVMRIMGLQKYGGIYHDLDYEIFDAKMIIKYMKSFNNFNAKEGNHWDAFVGNAFIASEANHSVINKMLRLMDRNLNQETDVPDYIKYPQKKFDAVLFKTGPVAMTMAYCKAANTEGKNDMIFPNTVLYNADYAKNPSGPLPSMIFEEVKVTTVGGDLFSGSWGSGDYHQTIFYNKEALEENKENKVPVSVLEQKNVGPTMLRGIQSDEGSTILKSIYKVFEIMSSMLLGSYSEPQLGQGHKDVDLTPLGSTHDNID